MKKLVKQSAARTSVFTYSGLHANSAAGAIAFAIFALPHAAIAQNECGLAPAEGGTVTCETEGNTYTDGVTYIAPLDDLTVVLEDGVVIDTSGGLNIGVLALGIGDTDIAVLGGTNTSITTDAQGAFGVLGATTSGALTLTLDDITTTGDNATGIIASSESGLVTVNVNTITTAGANADGISATTNISDIAIDAGTIVTTGLGAKGIEARSDFGDIAITVDAITTSGASNGFFNAGANGILAATGGIGRVTIDAGNVTTGGVGAIGIGAQTFDGLASVTADTVITTGASADAINVLATSGLADVDVGTVSTTGLNSRGIVATGGDGVTIAFDAVTTTGDGATGVLVPASIGFFGPRPTANATIAGGNVTTSGVAADGIFVAVVGGDATVTTGNVTVTGANSTAITAISDIGDVSVTSTGTVLASGANGGGIIATSGTGNAAVIANNVSTVAALAINTDSSRAAISATGANASVRVNGTAQTSGTGFAGANSATVMATATNGNASAVVNNLTARGDGVSALRVSATNNATATINGLVAALGDGADAVIVNGVNTAVVTVSANANVTAADGDGIVLISGTASTLNNGGILANNTNGFAVAAFGGPLTINNSGTLTSDILFTAGADRVNNTGTFVADTSPDFGAGADIFSNSGTVRFATGAMNPVSRTFTGLETFNNTGGLIDLRNTVAGDTLTLPGTFAGSANSRLGLDVNLSGSGTADRLIVSGAATGSTNLLISYSGPAGLNSGVILVDGGAGTQAGAFTLDGGSRNFGLIESDLVFDAANNNFVLVGAPTAAVYRTAAFVEGARNLWHVSADAWSAHMRGLRDSAWGSGAGGSGGRLWIQMHGATEQRENVVAVSNFGLNRTFDLGYDQDYFGGQIGLNFGGAAGENGNFSFGVTGGYVNSEMKFNNVSDRTKFDVFNAGAYAGVNSGSLFANVLAKYDWIKADSNSVIGQYAADFDGNSYGAKGEIGFRLGSDRFFVEPVASIAYVRTDLDDLNVQSSTIEFLDDEGLRGKLGARLGASFPSARLNTVVLYAGGNYVHEFKGDDSVAFTNNGRTVRIDNRAMGDYGEGVLGVNIGSTEGVSGFIEANGAKGSEYDAYGARAGLRIHF
jgi:trimeric autotransporter adhesin